MFGTMWLLLLPLCGLPLTRASDSCKKLIASGHEQFKGVYDVVPDSKYQGKSYWKHQTKDLFIKSFQQNNGYFWVIGYPLDAPTNTWKAFTLYTGQEYPENVQLFYLLWGYDPMDLRFKCVDYVESVPQYSVQMARYCDSNIVKSIVNSKTVTFKDCITQCESLPSCTAVTLFYDGCTMHKYTCLSVEPDPKLGSYHFSKERSTSAQNKPTQQSSTDWKGKSKYAVDGNWGTSPLKQTTCSHTQKETNPWWAVDLVYKYIVRGVMITARTDCCIQQIAGAVVALGKSGSLKDDLKVLTSKQFDSVTDVCGKVPMQFDPKKKQLVSCADHGYNTQYVLVYLDNTGPSALTICELEVLYNTPSRYTLFTKKLTKASGEAFCKDKLRNKGGLATIESKEDLNYIQKSLKNEKKYVMWTGQKAKSTNVYFEYWYPNSTKQLFNIASSSGTKCTSSTPETDTDCKQAIDGVTDSTSSWVFKDQYKVAWYKLEFPYEYVIQEVHLLQMLCSCRSLKDINMEFSDSSNKQFSLKQRAGADDADSAGVYWDTLHIGGKASKSVKITVKSLHETYTKAGGFLELMVIAEEKGGFQIHSGECTGSILETIYTDEVSCQTECRQKDKCKGFVHYFKGSKKPKCQLMSDCSKHNIRDNAETQTFIYSENSKEARFSLRRGYDSDCALMQLNSISDMHKCASSAAQFDNAVGFVWHTDQESANAGSCVHLYDCGTGQYDTSQNNEWISAIRIDINKVTGSSSSTTVGCYTHWPTQASPTQYPAYEQDVAGEAGYTHCKTVCKEYTYTGLQTTSCVCRNALGQLAHGCKLMCKKDIPSLCGRTPDMYNVHTTDGQAAASDCVQLSTKLQGTPLYDLVWLTNDNPDVVKMQTNFCDTEYPVLCENYDFDNCYSLPCHNGGSCTSSDYRFTCTCVDGYTGVLCEQEIDECSSSPCGDGGTCRDSRNGYSCVCVTGYTGSNCETNINDCKSDPCQHDSTCIDLVNKFQCKCKPGYTGKYCEINVNDCLSRPCRNGGACQDQINNFQCICKPGYTGVICERNVDECIVNGTNRCRNGAVCQDFVNGYKCHCKRGYTGDECETDISECDSSPCVNGATCTDLVDKYECQCLPGYDGLYCENNINECWSGPCKNNAPCIDLVNDYECQCLPGFSGSNCEKYSGNPGEWSVWSQWSACTASCNRGIKYRSRDCTPLFPQLGGGVCAGPDSEAEDCMIKACGPVDGNWGKWIEQASCDTACGPGRVRAHRTCDTPMPSNGGKDCIGISERWQLCQRHPCEVFGHCADWTSWTECLGSCGSSQRSKHRWCYSAKLKDQNFLTENIEYKEGNKTLSSKEEIYESCVREGCGRSVFECSVCESSFPVSDQQPNNCVQQTECSSTESVCMSEYTLTENNIQISKRCGKKQECSSPAISTVCQRIKALVHMTGLRLNSHEIRDLLLINVLMLWRHLGDTTCIICCNGANCNEDILPRTSVPL